MDNVLIVSLLFWPAVVLICAGLNMLISWTFSWAELIFDLLIGFIAGFFLFAGVQPNADGVVTFFFLFSHGVPALAWLLTGGYFDDPATFFWFMAGARIGATVWTAAWDHLSVKIGAKLSPGAFFFSLLLAPVKMAFSMATSAVGLLVWLAGLVWAIVSRAMAGSSTSATGGATTTSTKGNVGFAGGVLFSEFAPGSGGYYATTLGWTVQTWNGNCPFKHELYHTRQYIYMGDWLIPFWCLGTVWGVISAAATTGKSVSTQTAFGADGDVGNPIEIAAYQL